VGDCQHALVGRPVSDLFRPPRFARKGLENVRQSRRQRDKNDNNAIITEILQLRAERAKLLGFPTHAHWRLDNAMAKTPERAMELMEAVWKPAFARVREEVADMQALADKEGAKITIEPWDYRYYAEKVRKERYDLDQNEVKQYLQLEKLREGMFWVAGELFNFNFTPVDKRSGLSPGRARLGS
jgi:peptidyl-dipeptidase Dcp